MIYKVLKRQSDSRGLDLVDISPSLHCPISAPRGSVLHLEPRLQDGKATSPPLYSFTGRDNGHGASERKKGKDDVGDGGTAPEECGESRSTEAASVSCPRHLGKHEIECCWVVQKQWFSPFPMLCPFNVVVALDHKIMLLLLRNCHFATVMNHNVLYESSVLVDSCEKVCWTALRGQNPQVESP